MKSDPFDRLLTIIIIIVLLGGIGYGFYTLDKENKIAYYKTLA